MSVTSDTIKDIHDYNIDFANRVLFLNNCPSNSGDDNPGVEHRMASNLIKNIRILDSNSQTPILIHMNSIGGNLYDGMAIYDSILTCKSYVTVIVYSQAESMSSIILQSADARIMMPNSYFMLHYGSTGFFGNYLDAVNCLDFEKKYNERILDVYTLAFMNGRYFKEKYKAPTYSKARSYILKKLKSGDWYLDAEEAVYYGFADGILGDKNYKDINSL
jgi:ATP-dependent protease ClpP protease subunit